MISTASSPWTPRFWTCHRLGWLVTAPVTNKVHIKLMIYHRGLSSFTMENLLQNYWSFGAWLLNLVNCYLWFELKPKFCKGFPHWDLFFLWSTQLWGNPNQSINYFFGLPLYQLGGNYILCPSLSSLIFLFLKCYLTKLIWVLIIVEYSTISMLDYFNENLANVGLPEAWLGWDWT